MALANHLHPFRPLVAGAGILNPVSGFPGTLGFLAVHAASLQQYLVSARHVLIGAASVDGEPVFQSRPADGAVAAVELARSDVGLDCAAAALAPGVGADDGVLGIGRVGPPLVPVVGMRVLKSGMSTGVTEGVVGSVQNQTVRIDLPPGFPATYQLSGPGDSGALWVERDTRRAVALHHGVLGLTGQSAAAVDVAAVLLALNLVLP